VRLAAAPRVLVFGQDRVRESNVQETRRRQFASRFPPHRDPSEARVNHCDLNLSGTVHQGADHLSRLTIRGVSSTELYQEVGVSCHPATQLIEHLQVLFVEEGSRRGSTMTTARAQHGLYRSRQRYDTVPYTMVKPTLTPIHPTPPISGNRPSDQQRAGNIIASSRNVTHMPGAHGLQQQATAMKERWKAKPQAHPSAEGTHQISDTCWAAGQPWPWVGVVLQENPYIRHRPSRREDGVGPLRYSTLPRLPGRKRGDAIRECALVPGGLG
jgi:hypothetical protein